MATTTRSWWRRITETFRGGGSEDGHALPPVGPDGLLVNPAEGEGSGADPPSERPLGALARWNRRDQVLNQLQEGYEQVSRLIGDIQRHLAAQSERTERLCLALEQLARASSDAPEIARQQTRMLEAISGQLEVTGARTQRLAEAVEEVPRLARTQTEALTGINRQLSMMSEQGVVTAQAMDKLGNAMRTLGDTNAAQAELLRQMYAQSDSHEAALRQLLEGQSRRFTMLFAVTLLLALVAVTAVVVSMWRG